MSDRKLRIQNYPSVDSARWIRFGDRLRRIGMIDDLFLTWVFMTQERTSLQANMRRAIRFANKPGVPMSIVKRHLAEHEERLVLIEEICIDKGALVYDIDSDEVFFSADEEAYKPPT
jgi:hypothetical protein